MNIPKIKSYEEQAVDVVVTVLNRAKETLGKRQSLKQLATSRDAFSAPTKVALTSLKCPLAITGEDLIRNTIENKWKLTENLMYFLKYIGGSKDECSQYYYFEEVSILVAYFYCGTRLLAGKLAVSFQNAKCNCNVTNVHCAMDGVTDEHIAVFSQPTPAYPIPQATASVFFRIEDKKIEPVLENGGVPKMTFRVEGHRTDHDVRYVLLVPDWILGVIQMKIKLFRRIEQIRLF